MATALLRLQVLDLLMAQVQCATAGGSIKAPRMHQRRTHPLLSPLCVLEAVWTARQI